MSSFVLDPTVDITASVPRSSRKFQRRQYRDKQFKGGEAEWKERLDKSSTVYVGNLSCYTSEYQLYELFTRCGSIKRIIMGLDKIKKTPCGFCFVEYDERESAMGSINYLNRTHLDGREIQIDIDAGFEEGRQYGRGASGGQVGDERRAERNDFDGSGMMGRPRGMSGGPGQQFLTRSITIVACIAMISILLIAEAPEPVKSDIVIKPFGFTKKPNMMLDITSIKQGQASKDRDQFEKNIAMFLVNIMKNAKPTLLKAFIQATLADEKLKEIAIGLFFNATSTDPHHDT